MRHKTKDKGDLGVAKTIPHMLEHGIRCCLPLSEHLPFDLIAVMPDFTTLCRVQVKYRTCDMHGAIAVQFRSNYYDSKKIYRKPVNLDEIDAYAVYCPETNEAYYFQVSEIPDGNTTLTFRIQPPKNGQKWGVRLAKDFANPLRIAPGVEASPAFRRDVSELDELAVVKAFAALIEAGIQPCPTMSQYLPFDMIGVYPNMKTLQRIRVGWEDVEQTPYADQYAVYDPVLQQCVFFDADKLPPERIRSASKIAQRIYS